MPELHFKRRDSLSKSFLAERFRDLDQATYKRDKPSEKFIPYSSLETIWTDARLEEFVDLTRPGFDRALIPFVKENLLRTLSILIYIGWSDWKSFGDIFLHHMNSDGQRDRLDDRIPSYDLETLCALLYRTCAGRFLTERWTFLPIVIEEGSTQHFSQYWRLPFVDQPSVLISSGESGNSGGYGQVTKEVIASRQFSASSALCGPSQHEFPVARRRYATRSDFRRATRYLESLRSLHHRHIAFYLSIVVVGNEYNLFSPLAEMDLERFLTNKAHGLLRDLISETRNVVGALGFLNGTLRTDHFAFCHNDLKPANILVFKEPDSSPVGTWKIADIDISVVAKADEQTSIGIGPEGDVWSMGCILMRILALEVEGTIASSLGRDAMGGLDFEHYFHRGLPTSDKPPIQKWIEALPKHARSDAVEFWDQSHALLDSMRAIQKRDRPSADAVFERLGHIKELVPRKVMVTSLDTVTDSTTSTGGISGEGTGSSKSASVPSVFPQHRIPAKYVVDAIVSGRPDVLDNLLRADVDVEELYDGDRALLYAVKKRNAIAVELLQQHHPRLDVDSPGQDGQTPLAIASAQGDPELVDLLLEMGAAIDGISGSSRKTPLMYAARSGHREVVATLLDQRASCRCYCLSGWTPLDYAIYGPGGGDLIDLFIGRADFDDPLPGGRGAPLLMLIKLYQNTQHWWDKYRALLRRYPNVNKRDAHGYSPLSIAIENDCVELAEDLINQGAGLPADFSQIVTSSDAKMANRAPQTLLPPQRLYNALSRPKARPSFSFQRATSKRQSSIQKFQLPESRKNALPVEGADSAEATEIVSPWELPALVEHIPDIEAYLLGTATLTKTEHCVKMLTCERYIREAYGDSGIALLRNVVLALKSDGRVYIDDTMKIEVQQQQISASFAESASKHWKLLLWLCQTFRQPIRDFHVCLSAGKREGRNLVLGRLHPIDKGFEDAYCWCGLFEAAIIALEPGTQLDQESWLEIDFNHLLQLAAVEYPMVVDSGIVLMGYSTALIPIKKIDDQTILWHLEIAKHDSQMKTSELAAVKGLWLQDIKLEDLRSKRALLGWCSQAVVRLGTKDLEADVRWSDADLKKTTWHWNGANLQLLAQSTAPLQVGGQAGMSFTRTINTRRFSQASNYLKVLRSTSMEQIVIYDVSQGRAWLVPLICVLHQMLLTYWKMIPEESRKLNTPPLAQPASDGAWASLTALMNRGGCIVEGDKGDRLTIRELILGFSANLSKASVQQPHRSEIYGYEFMDIVMDSPTSELKRKKISKEGLVWVPLLSQVNCLFCSGLGDAVVGSRACVQNSPCNQVPIGLDWMAVPMRSMNALSFMHGCEVTRMARLSSHHYWFPTGSPFQRCQHGRDSQESCWRSSPVLQEIRNDEDSRLSKVEKVQVFPDGAVVFGRRRETGFYNAVAALLEVSVSRHTESLA